MQTAPDNTVPTQALPELWDDAQLAEYLGVGERFVRRICAEGRIRYLRISNRRRFDPVDVKAYLESEKRGGAEPDPPRRPSGRPLKASTRGQVRRSDD